MKIDWEKHGIKTKKEYYNFLIKNKMEIVALKKNSTKFTDVGSFNPIFFNIVSKSIQKAVADDTATGVIKRTIIGNTYLWLDSHGDVHIPGIFTKSLQENKKNVPHLHDHIQALDAKVGTPTDIYEKQIPWTELGVARDGNTTSLFMDSEIRKMYNESIFNQYSNDEINQHSVGMRYMKLLLAINDPDYKEEYANWQTYFPMIGNPDKATEEGVFWPIIEAQLKEISCVIAGSNELTPTLGNKSQMVRCPSCGTGTPDVESGMGYMTCQGCNQTFSSNKKEPLFSTPSHEPVKTTRKFNLSNLTNNFKLS